MLENKPKNVPGQENNNPDKKDRKQDPNTNFPKSPIPEPEKVNKDIQHDQDR
jgi:hypothetical protein